MVAANVVEGAEGPVFAARDDERFAADISGDELTFFAELIETADDLPGGGENAGEFEIGEALVEIPGSGNGPGVFQRVARVVEVQDGFETRMHAADCLSVARESHQRPQTACGAGEARAIA